ncbi:MAG: hypothetical protein Q9221_005450 [Calogaya cf. arnoldii]
MASADNPSRAHSSVADEKGNPFVTFSRLVDQQMSSLFRNMLDFPNSFGTARSNLDRSGHSRASADEQRRWREEAEEFEKSLDDFFGQQQENRHNEEETPRPAIPFSKDLYTRQSVEEHRQDQQLDAGKEREEARRILDCVRDAFFQMNPDDEANDYDPPQLRCPYRPESTEVTQGRSTLPFWRRAPVPTLTDYIGEDPYSPLQLEDRHPFCEHGAKWRRAFADLLAVQHGVDAPCEHKHEEMSKENWMLALPVYLASQQDLAIATKQPENEAEGDAPTELDLYKHFLGAPSSRVPSSIPTQPSSIMPGNHDALGQPTLISTMTTTQRTTRPDGSVYTQVVLKKRFSDGREESTETEHTTHDTKGDTEPTRQSPRSHEYAAKPIPRLGYDGKVKQAIGQRLEEKKKNGWFWS